MYNKRLSDDEKLVPVSNPRTLVPYMSTRDCSQGFCSFYCPQWCYIIFPPPPQFDLPDDDDDSGPNFSPLVIAIIGILASAFLLVSYYTLISKYCGNSRRRENRPEESELEEEDHDPSNHEAWNVNAGGGLDEALIKSITVFKYKKCDGLLTEGTDCSVCLSEFQEDESLRLLPKCSHAFHVMCIDTWLKSHSNCPLCRAQITFSNAPPPPLPPPVMEAPREIETTPPIQPERDIEMGMIRVEEARDEEEKEEDVTNQNHRNQEVRRRSLSMDYASQRRLSIADVLRIDHDEFHDCVTGEDCELQRDVGTSKQENNGEEMSKGGIRNNSLVQYCVASPMMMKRSLSSGRFLFTKCGRGQNMAIPLSNVCNNF